MAGAGVFHVEFGINDTQLTRALDQGNYATAERAIRDNTVPSYLDEGCYQRIPLFICMCGTDEEEKRSTPRNLYLAKLLIEFGASINLRVPATYFGSEYMSPGKTALELLADFYNDLTKYGNNYNNEFWSAYHSGWDPSVDVVIGLNKQPLTSLEEVIEHVEDLIFIILSNGGDPNVTDENKMTVLHKTAIFSHDVRLFKLLCENAANINAVDCHGNTPLLSLCDIAEEYDYLEDLSPSSDDTLEDTSATLLVKREFLNYLLSQRDLEINATNNRSQTALFHCVIRGDISACSKLLCKGTDASIRGTVWETRKRKRKLSPLFATFLSLPVQRTLGWQNMYHKLASAPQQYSYLVDAGYFTTKEIVAELEEYIENEFPEFLHLRQLGGQLVHLMFGRTTATLRQMAARTLFRQCFINNTTCVTKLLPIETIKQKLSTDDLKHIDTYEEYITLILNRTVMQALVTYLSLPQDSLVNFEIELFLYQLAMRFSVLKFLPPENMFEGDGEGNIDFSDEDSSDLSVGEGDSDLEYW